MKIIQPKSTIKQVQINSLSTKRFIVITTRRALSLLAVAETFQVIEVNLALFFWQKTEFFPGTLEISQKVSKM